MTFAMDDTSFMLAADRPDPHEAAYRQSASLYQRNGRAAIPLGVGSYKSYKKNAATGRARTRQSLFDRLYKNAFDTLQGVISPAFRSFSRFCHYIGHVR
jgi:hypothetical protein